MATSLSTRLGQFVQQQWLKKGIFSYLLSPLSWLVQYYTERKYQKHLNAQLNAYRAPVPVIIVGNIFVGGTGKTPFTIALVKALQERGHTPGIISRGYGVDIGEHAQSAHSTTANASLIGDEPSLLAQYAPIAVHPKRQLAIEKLLADYPSTSIIISDDGLQHYALARDIEIVLQDTRGIGNGLLLPAGPLRESPSRLKYVDYIVTNYNTLAALQQAEVANSLENEPRYQTMYLELSEIEQLSTGKRFPIQTFAQQFQHHKLYAIAGIGRPERFYQSLNQVGLPLHKTVDFPDHYAFTANDFETFGENIVLMTDKDASKCRNFAQNNWYAVHTRAVLSNPDFFNQIHQKIQHLPLYSTKD